MGMLTNIIRKLHFTKERVVGGALVPVLCKYVGFTVPLGLRYNQLANIKYEFQTKMDFKIPKEFQRDRAWPSDEYAVLMISVARILYQWNTIEQSTRGLLNHLSGGGETIDILTTHMGTQSQIDALKTIASRKLTGEKKVHALHLCSLYERLRSYRNFFIHAFNSLSSDTSNLPIESDGTIKVTSGQNPALLLTERVAKGKLLHQTLMVNEDKAEEFAEIITAANGYIASVICHFYYAGLGMESHAEFENLPSLFPIPPKLSKKQVEVASRPVERSAYE